MIESGTLRRGIMTHSRTAVLYHAYDTKDGLRDCPDGIAAAAIVHMAIASETMAVDLYPVTDRESSRSEAIRAVCQSQPKAIYVVDYARFSETEFEELRAIAPVIVFDHHSDKFDYLHKLSASLTLTGRWHADRACGASIAWDELHGGARPWWINFTLIRDVGLDYYYEGLIPYVEAVATAMSTVRHGYSDPIAFFEALNATTQEAFFAEQAEAAFKVLEARNEAIALYWDVWQSKPEYLEIDTENATYSVPFFDLLEYDHLHRHMSALGAQLAMKCPGGIVAIRTIPPHNGLQPISFRAIEGKNARPLAQSFAGGGGHERACGCAMPLPLPVLQGDAIADTMD
jgi:hypothetical protein